MNLGLRQGVLWVSDLRHRQCGPCAKSTRITGRLVKIAIRPQQGVLHPNLPSVNPQGVMAVFQVEKRYQGMCPWEKGWRTWTPGRGPMVTSTPCWEGECGGDGD